MPANSERMYYYFGRDEAHKCRDCVNFVKVECGNKGFIGKCRVYGVTASEASDWGGTRTACGHFGKPNAYSFPVIRWPREKLKESQIPGQTSLWEE